MPLGAAPWSTLWETFQKTRSKKKPNQEIVAKSAPIQRSHRATPAWMTTSPEPHAPEFDLILTQFWPQIAPLVAFHPRPQIASDLGRNVTRSFNPHRNRNQFPSGNESLAYGRRFKSQPASTRCDLRIASPTRPLLQVIWTPQIADPQAAIAELGPPGGCKSQNRRPQGH